MHKFQKTSNAAWGLLFPAAFIWGFVAKVRRKYLHNAGYLSALPVVCVGNLHSGGSGKTPLVLAIAEALKSEMPERRHVVLSRGYRGRLSKEGGEVTEGTSLGPRDFGDEPWMLKQALGCPVYVGRERVKMVQEIERKHPDALVILDDGFQNFSLRKTLSFVVVSALKSPEATYCLPWGELREGLSALNFCDAVVLTGTDELSISKWKALLQAVCPGTPVLRVEEKIAGFFSESGVVEPPRHFAAFCGLAEPRGFRETIERQGGTFVHAFPDHHKYQKSDVDWILKRAKEKNLEHVVTTEKDWYKIKDFVFSPVKPLFVKYRYQLPTELIELLKKGIP